MWSGGGGGSRGGGDRDCRRCDCRVAAATAAAAGSPSYAHTRALSCLVAPQCDGGGNVAHDQRRGGRSTRRLPPPPPLAAAATHTIKRSARARIRTQHSGGVDRRVATRSLAAAIVVATAAIAAAFACSRVARRNANREDARALAATMAAAMAAATAAMLVLIARGSLSHCFAAFASPPLSFLLFLPTCIAFTPASHRFFLHILAKTRAIGAWSPPPCFALLCSASLACPLSCSCVVGGGDGYDGDVLS